MKHQITTLNTKVMFSQSLKKLMEKKPLSKITVSEIVADCQVNRKTFYYHFEDIYNLLRWTLERETVEVLKNFDLLINYEQAIYFVLDYIENNNHILNCVYDSIGCDQLKRFLYDDFFGIVMSMITELETSMNISCDEKFKDFLCSFYTEALAGKIIDLLKHKETLDRKTLVEYVSVIFKHALPNALLEMSVKN